MRARTAVGAALAAALAAAPAGAEDRRPKAPEPPLTEEDRAILEDLEFYEQLEALEAQEMLATMPPERDHEKR